ncbi:MAG: fimbiral protein pilA [Polyangiaceae bacterium]
MQPPYGYPQPQKSQSSSTIWIILAVVGVFAIFAIGVMASLAIFGVRKYLADAKQAEAMNSLGEISRSAVAAYAAEGTGTSANVLCASASRPIPASVTSVRGTKYESTTAEWQADAATNSGFFCLKFEMASPQYYQYDYQRTGSGTKTGDGFSGIAHGDLNADGVESTYALGGTIDASGTVALDPAPRVTNAGE